MLGKLLWLLFVVVLVLAATIDARSDTLPAGTWAGEIYIMPDASPDDVMEPNPPTPEALQEMNTQPTGDKCVSMNDGNEAYRDCYVGDPEHVLPEWLAHFQDTP